MSDRQSAGASAETASGGEVLYNGIQLPEQWPPHYGKFSGEPMAVPYLATPPEVIPMRPPGIYR